MPAQKKWKEIANRDEWPYLPIFLWRNTEYVKYAVNEWILIWFCLKTAFIPKENIEIWT